MFVNPTFGGIAIFGLAVEVRAQGNPAALQLDSYQAVNGMTSLFGGTRGGTLTVKGSFEDLTVPDVNADVALLESYNDGIARTFVDCEGNVYFNTVFTGRIRKGPALATALGWTKQYECDFVVLSG